MSANATGGVAINQFGAIAGSGVTSTDREFAYIWDGAATVLAMGAQASAINSSGAIAGTVRTSGRADAVVWTESGGSLLTPGMNSYATGINDAGDVVGSVTRDGATGAFISRLGALTGITTPGIWSSAYDVNNNGQVVGTFQTEAGAFGAFSWTDVTGTVSLSSVGGGSYAMAVSDSGLVVGSSVGRDGYLHAFAYGAVMQDLGTLRGTTSAAYGVNNLGHIVGYSYDADGRQRAFVWMDGTMYDLNDFIPADSGWTLEAAYGINDRGQITGIGAFGGASSAFVLDSFTTDPESGRPAIALTQSAVPEPGTGLFVAVIAGCVVIATRIRSR